MSSAFGGMQCPALYKWQVCNTQVCPVSCQVSSWGTWSPCSVVCGDGSRTRDRGINIAPEYGGKACPVLKDSRACLKQACSSENFLPKRESGLVDVGACGILSCASLSSREFTRARFAGFLARSRASLACRRNGPCVPPSPPSEHVGTVTPQSSGLSHISDCGRRQSARRQHTEIPATDMQS